MCFQLTQPHQEKKMARKGAKGSSRSFNKRADKTHRLNKSQAYRGGGRM